jgi:acetyl esterase/lipase
MSSRKVRSQLSWFGRARPTDYVLALADACASIPVVGRHLEFLGGLTAMGAWGRRYAPDLASAALRSRWSVGATSLRRDEMGKTAAVAEAAIRAVAPFNATDLDWHPADQPAPVTRAALHRRRYLYRSSIRYGRVVGQRLDVWRRRDLPPGPAPVLIFVPGGAWVHGRRILQGYALMSHLAQLGWVCLSIDYRVAPHHLWPRHANDVKAAVAWARMHVDEFGGDPSFIAVAGCSAGGHLASLIGLTADQYDLHVELPCAARTDVDAVVSLYGRYDWEDRSTHERERFVDFLERVVVKRRQKRHPEIFRAASPIARVRSDAPPFLVIHGTADTIIPVAQARAFVQKLRSVSESVVGYLELPGGHHGFDMTDGDRTVAAVTVISAFLAEVRRNSKVARTGEAR